MAKVTLQDVAEHAGVHASTVSRALDPEKATLVNPETRDRVRAAASELGYRGDAVASGLRRGKTNTIGLVVADIANPFIGPVVRGIENNLEGRDKMLFVAESQDDHGRMSRVMDSLLGRRVDAVITTAARLGDERLLRQIAEQVPLVLAVRNLPGSGLVAITHDDERGGRLAAQHLVQTGHRRVAQLRGSDDISSFRGRGRGFEEYLAETDVELVEPSESGRHPVLAEGRRVMNLLLDEVDELPTAVFAHNDLMAFGALQAMAERGLSCPGDMAVIGYNDTIMTEFTDPPITTVRLPGYELGRMAADTAVALIDDDHRPDPPLSLPPVLVPRLSTLGWSADA